MDTKTSTISKFDLWILLGIVQHTILVIRQKELRQEGIYWQTLVLFTIHDLGTKATLSEVAKIVGREPHVISRQTTEMEKEGLLKRTRHTKRSNLLKLELTEKGQQIVKTAKKSKSIEKIFSYLTEDECNTMASILNKLYYRAKKYTD